MKAQIVVGLGFGDEGKGITTDFLCSQRPDSLVVRFSGGQQCGHTVYLGKIKHVHGSFASGTLRGLPSYFTEHCTFYPVTIFNELTALSKIGISPKLYLHPFAKLTTPFDLIANRIKEMTINHGSCGLGVGMTMKRNAEGYKLFAVDLINEKLLRVKLEEVRKYYEDQFHFNEKGRAWLDEELRNFYQILPLLPIEVVDYSFLRSFNNLVFEGSQGILLDQSHGIFPHVTYADTTSKNALQVCRKLKTDDPEIFYVTRCYSSRHGNGWMPNEDQIALINNAEETNVYNDFQGNFRIGEIDYELLKYAIKVDESYSGALEKNLVVTCLDQRAGFQFDYQRMETVFKDVFESYSPFAEKIIRVQKK